MTNILQTLFYSNKKSYQTSKQGSLKRHYQSDSSEVLEPDIEQLAVAKLANLIHGAQALMVIWHSPRARTAMVASRDTWPYQPVSTLSPYGWKTPLENQRPRMWR